jgi:hypothetical protein
MARRLQWRLPPAPGAPPPASGGCAHSAAEGDSHCAGAVAVGGPSSAAPPPQKAHASEGELTKAALARSRGGDAFSCPGGRACRKEPRGRQVGEGGARGEEGGAAVEEKEHGDDKRPLNAAAAAGRRRQRARVRVRASKRNIAGHRHGIARGGGEARAARKRARGQRAQRGAACLVPTPTTGQQAAAGSARRRFHSFVILLSVVVLARNVRCYTQLSTLGCAVSLCPLCKHAARRLIFGLPVTASRLPFWAPTSARTAGPLALLAAALMPLRGAALGARALGRTFQWLHSLREEAERAGCKLHVTICLDGTYC